MGDRVLEPVKPVFRAIAETVVPESARLDSAGWKQLETIIGDLLLSKPASMRKQILVFIRLLNWLTVFRYGRRFTKLPPGKRTRFLSAVENSSLTLFRLGFWGLRSLVFMGYYGRPEAATEIGYTADPRGWEALR